MGAARVKHFVEEEIAFTETYARMQELLSRYEEAFKRPHAKVGAIETAIAYTRGLRQDALEVGVPLPHPTPLVLRSAGSAAAAAAPSNAPDCAVAAGGAGCAGPAPAAALAAAASAPPPPPPPPSSNAPDFEPAPPPPPPSKSNAPSLDGGRRRGKRTRRIQKKRRSIRKTLRRR